MLGSYLLAQPTRYDVFVEVSDTILPVVNEVPTGQQALLKDGSVVQITRKDTIGTQKVRWIRPFILIQNPGVITDTVGDPNNPVYMLAEPTSRIYYLRGLEMKEALGPVIKFGDATGADPDTQ